EMTEIWKQWEGEVINGEFHLREYLGGTDHSAVFLTERGQHNQQKAAIKLIPDDPYNTKRQLSRWAAAAELSHPHLLRLFQMGRLAAFHENRACTIRRRWWTATYYLREMSGRWA